MLYAFHLYLEEISANQDLPFSWDFWEEVENLLEEREGEVVTPLWGLQKIALEGAHNAPLLDDREGFKHLYRFLSGVRRSEGVIKSAQARKEASKKRAMYREQLGNKLRKAMK